MGSPSTRTVQTPQSPISQPFFAPVMPSLFRRTSRRISPSRTGTGYACPLTLRTMVRESVTISFPFLRGALRGLRQGPAGQRLHELAPVLRRAADVRDRPRLAGGRPRRLGKDLRGRPLAGEEGARRP